MSQTTSTTTTSQRQLKIFIQESSSDSRPSNLHDLEIDDYTIGRALSSPLFTHEREDPASRRQPYHSPDESLLSSQSSSVGHVRTGRPVSDEFGSQISNVRENPRCDSENEQIRILLERQKEQILAVYRAEIQKHEFQADYDRRSIQKLNGVIESQRGEIDRAHQGDEQLRRDQQLLHEQLLEQNRELREAHVKSLNEMEELERFQGSTFGTIPRRKLIEDRDTILELSGKIQELQNQINCMNDSRDFEDAESVRTGQSHVASQRVFFPPHPVPGGMLSRSIGMPSGKNGPTRIWGHTWYIRKRFCKSSRVFFSTLSAGIESMEFSCVGTNSLINGGKPNTRHRIRDAGPDRLPKVQWSLVREILRRIMEQTNNDCRFWIFTKTNSLSQQHLLVGRFKTEVCTCSQFSTEAMQWIKEVEMVDSAVDLKSSSSVRGIQMPNFEVLDAKIASALNRIIRSSVRFVWRIQILPC